jgi:glycosyltransferase involved in cell wall biosynthesis
MSADASGRLRVAFVITGLEAGGAEHTLLRVLPRLVGTIRPKVLSMTGLGPIGERLQAAGIEVEALGMPRSGAALWRLPALIGWLRAEAPEVVQTVLYHANLVGGLAARLAGVRSVAWSIHNSAGRLDAVKRSTRHIVHASARLSGWLPDRIMCCSELALRNHVALGYDASRFELIPNGFDLDLWRPDREAHGWLRAQFGFPAEAPVIGLFARLDPQKNHAGFFEAAGLLHRERPDVRFVLAGQGVTDATPQVRAWMERAGVAGVTRLLGQRDDVARLAAGLDLSVLMSIGEAFPNTVGESMACGVPCVVTDVGDAALMVGPTGVVVPVDDPRAAAQAWRAVLELPPDERRRMGQAARARIAERYELSVVARRYADFYQRLAGPSAARA